MSTPFDRHLGVEIGPGPDGRVQAVLDILPEHCNRRGVAHGGVIVSLLDAALGAAVIASIPSEAWCATTSLSTQFIAGARPGRLVARGRVLRRGERVAFAAGEALDAAGKLVASAQGTWHLWSSRPGLPRISSRGTIVDAQSGEALRVGKILAVGRNYADHAAEMGVSPERSPVLFFKPATALVGDGAVVRLPADAGRVEHEVELVVVIGSAGRAIPAERGLEHVLGFAVGIDLTLRDLQAEAKANGEPWSIAKGFDDSAPVSTFVPRAAVGDGSGLSITLDVNGERRQCGNTSAMRLGVASLVALASRHVTLERGDLLFTGTPEGVGPIIDGDLIEARIDRVGSLRVTARAEREEKAP